MGKVRDSFPVPPFFNGPIIDLKKPLPPPPQRSPYSYDGGYGFNEMEGCGCGCLVWAVLAIVIVAGWIIFHATP